MATFLARVTGRADAGQPRVPAGPRPAAGPGAAAGEARGVGLWGFAGVAVTSFGGPLALAALYAPVIAGGASPSAGLAMVAAALAFGVPIWIWLSYAREVRAPGGLYAFVEEAAGRRVALAQAGLWTISYLLYLAYTTTQIAYDTLPAVLPGERRYQRPLEIVIPVAIAAVMIAGRRVTLLVTGLLAAGQLALAGALGGLTMASIGTPASAFGAGAPAGSLAIASAQMSLLYICGSLPLFLQGDIHQSRRGNRTDQAGSGARRNPSFGIIRTGIVGAYAVTVAVIVASVAPLAAVDGFTRAPIPGMAVASAFGGHGFGVAVGIGVAASIAGVILVEYLALSRLAVAVTGWPARRVIIGIGAFMVGFAPVTLINPHGIYDALVKPSLVALWLSQLIVFAAYPRFAVRHRKRALPARTLAVAASALAAYGIWATIQVSGT